MNLTKLEKAIEKINESFCGEVRGMTEAQIKDVVCRLALQVEDITTAKENDSELEDLKQQIKEIEAPYKESLKNLRTQLKFAIGIMDEKKGIE